MHQGCEASPLGLEAVGVDVGDVVALHVQVPELLVGAYRADEKGLVHSASAPSLHPADVRGGLGHQLIVHF